MPWEEYRNYFFRLNRLNDWDEDEKLDILLVQLTGEAQRFVDGGSAAITASFRRLDEALQQRFGAQQQAAVHQAALKSRVRKDGETLAALAQEIRYLVKLAYPGFSADAAEVMAIERFTHALTTPALSKAVYDAEPSSLDLAVKAAAREEAWHIPDSRNNVTKVRFRGTSPEPLPGTSPREINELKKKVDSLTSEMADVRKSRSPQRPSNSGCYMCGDPNHWQRQCPRSRTPSPHSSRGCYICGDSKHIKRDCPRSPARSRNPSPGRGQSTGCYTCGDTRHFKRDCPRTQSPHGRYSHPPIQQYGSRTRSLSPGRDRPSWNPPGRRDSPHPNFTIQQNRSFSLANETRPRPLETVPSRTPDQASARMVGIKLARPGPEEMRVIVTIPTPKGDEHVAALIDTGAERSFMGTELLNRLQFRNASLDVRSADPGLQLCAVNNTPIEIHNIVHLTLETRLGVIQHDFLITDVGPELVLGCDFMRTNRWEWSWRENNVRLSDDDQPGRRIPLEDNVRRRAITIYAENDLHIPPWHGLPVTGVLHEEPQFTLGVVTGDPRMEEEIGLSTEEAVVSTTTGRLPVHLINSSSEEIVINQGSLIATVVQVEEEDLQPTGQVYYRRATTAGEMDVEMQKLYQDCAKDLSPVQAEKVKSLLVNFRDAFACTGEPLGRTNLVQHEIRTGDARPVRVPPRRLPIHMEQVVRAELTTLLEQGVIQSSESPWSAPVVMVKKKDGSNRFCVDYRRLNDLTEKDAYPLPNIEDNLAQLGGGAWFATLDLASGYWQVGMKQADQPKTAFTTPFGLYEWTAMPFGLCNAPSTFERLMEHVLREERGNGVLLYLDDVIVFGSTFEELLQRLEQVFRRLSEAGLKLKPKKCNLFQREVSFLGHVVSEEGIQTDPAKITK